MDSQRTGHVANEQPELDITFDVGTTDGKTFRGTARHIAEIDKLVGLTQDVNCPYVTIQTK